MLTKIAIIPEVAESGPLKYRAIAGRQQSVGDSAGQALDALTASLEGADSTTLVIVQRQQPDRFFTLEQQARLRELMPRWRSARDGGSALSPDEEAELNALVDAEVQAAGERAAALLRELGQ